MGRKSLPAESKRRQYTVQLTPTEAEGLVNKYGSVNAAVRTLVDAPAPRGPLLLSPVTGKPLCENCQRKGYSPHCRKCGPNAEGKS